MTSSSNCVMRDVITVYFETDALLRRIGRLGNVNRHALIETQLCPKLHSAKQPEFCTGSNIFNLHTSSQLEGVRGKTQGVFWSCTFLLGPCVSCSAFYEERNVFSSSLVTQF